MFVLSVYSMFYHDGVCLSCVSCNKTFTYFQPRHKTLFQQSLITVKHKIPQEKTFMSVVGHSSCYCSQMFEIFNGACLGG